MVNNIERLIRNNKFVLIAEMGVNYYDIAINRNMSTMDAAKYMIKEAAEAGVHAVKFQSYKAETLASNNSPYYWDISEEPTKTQRELFKKYDAFAEKEYRELADYSDECNVEFLSTPFDISSADYLESMMNVYKISSSDMNNLPFVKYIAKKNKPIIISVGASNLDEIVRIVDLIMEYNNQQITLMHCVLEYPTPYEHANLRKIVSLKKAFPNMKIGYSDHTKPDECMDVIKTAYVLGANIIEKHFTLDKTIKGNDHYHAMDKKDTEAIVRGVKFIEQLQGDGNIVCLESEEKARANARRSVVANAFIPKGEVISESMLTWKRPGTGIPVDQIESVVGRKSLCDIHEDTIMQYDYLE